MMEEHGAACARRIVEQRRAEGSDPGEIARGIHAHCGVSLLRAHRLTYGWTLAHVAASFEFAAGAGDGHALTTFRGSLS
jgi:hypothetical protein